MGVLTYPFLRFVSRPGKRRGLSGRFDIVENPSETRALPTRERRTGEIVYAVARVTPRPCTVIRSKTRRATLSGILKE